jgi:hypothetical protein
MDCLEWGQKQGGEKLFGGLSRGRTVPLSARGWKDQVMGGYSN